MKNTELFYLIFKQTHMDKFLYGFVIYYFFSCIVIWIIDPSVNSFWDALWFGFMIITTIGFGDFTVTSFFGRLVTAILGIYGIFLIAFVCGVGASYLFARTRIGKNESVSQMIWQLEHLDQLDEKNLKDLKTKIQARRVLHSLSNSSVSSQKAKD